MSEASSSAAFERLPHDALFQPLRTAFFVLDKDWVCRAANPAFYGLVAKYSACPPDDVIGRRIDEVFQSTDTLARHWPAVLSGQTQSRQGYRIALNVRGQPLESWWDFTVVALRGHTQNFEGALVLLDEATAPTQAEQTLGDNDSKYRFLIEKTSDIIYAVDAEGIITFCSPQIARYGYVPADLLGHSFGEFVHPEDRQAMLETFRLAMSGVETTELNGFRLLGKDGRYHDVEETGKPICDQGRTVANIGIVRDVSERKRAEAALRASEAKYRSVVDNVPMPIARLDRHLKFVFVNKLHCLLFQQSESEVLGRGLELLERFVTPEQLKCNLAAIEEALREQRRTEIEVCRHGANGEEHWGIQIAYPWYDGSGQLGGVELIGQDITERKRAEAAVQQQIALEDLVLRISTNLSSAEVVDLVGLMRTALQELALFQGITHAGVVLFADDKKTLSYLCGWSVGDLPREGDQAVPLEKFSWATSRILRGQTIQLNMLSDLPAEAVAERARWRHYGIKSLLFVPMLCGKDITGWIGFDTRDREHRWSEEEVKLLRVVGELFAQALHRQKAEQQIRKLNADLEFRVQQRTYELQAANALLFDEIQQRRKSEEAARLNEARLEALEKLGRLSGASLQQMTDFTLEQGVALTRSDFGYLAFVSDDESTVTTYAWSRATMAHCRLPQTQPALKVAETGLYGETIRQRQAVIINDYAQAHPLKKGTPEGHIPLLRYLAVPIFDGKRIVAVAGVANKPEDYNQADARQLTLLYDGMWRLLQKQRADEALRLSEEHFRRMFDQSPIGAAIVSLDYRFLRVNAELCRITGYTPEELISFGFPHISDPEDLRNNTAQLRRIELGEIDQYQTYKRFIRKDGSFVWTRLSVRLIRDAHGSPQYFLPMVEDVTKTKQRDSRKKGQ